MPTASLRTLKLLLLFALLVAPAPAAAERLLFGLRLSAGGRFDNVRMCVATPAGIKGGPAMDISFFTEIGLKERVSLIVNLPVMRPILFGAAFRMLQLEPEVTLAFRRNASESTDWIFGPSLGLTLHYGPDYHSDSSGEGRRPSFFALGPTIGGYVGLDFLRPERCFNFQLGLRPYVAPLSAVSDPDKRRGLVLGGVLEGQLRFRP